MLRIVMVAALVGCLSGCSRTEGPAPQWPNEGSTVFLSQYLGGAHDAISSLHQREHRGGVSRPCVPMRVITASLAAGRIVLEDDLQMRHELIGSWEADLHKTEAECLAAARAHEAAKAQIAESLATPPKAIETTAAQMRAQRQRDFCPDTAASMFLSVPLPEGAVAGDSPGPLPACSPLRKCKGSGSVTIARDSAGGLRRLEGAWSRHTYTTESSCRSSVDRSEDAEVYVVHHQSQPGVLFYRIAEDE